MSQKRPKWASEAEAYLSDLDGHKHVWYKVYYDPMLGSVQPVVYVDTYSFEVRFPEEYYTADVKTVKDVVEWAVKCFNARRTLPYHSERIDAYLLSKDFIRARRRLFCNYHGFDMRDLTRPEPRSVFEFAGEMNPKLAVCYHSMKICVIEGDHLIRSDYMSRTLVVSSDLLDIEDVHDWALALYVVYREMACMMSYDEDRVFDRMMFKGIMKYHPNRDFMEEYCKKKGWSFKRGYKNEKR